ncbi:MAG TPA: CocE/NonD family hydrolase [Flavobacteriales bacterium]|nr:CocE/NonD family hydrolase [Flavobacteriales bacterium]
MILLLEVCASGRSHLLERSGFIAKQSFLKPFRVYTSYKYYVCIRYSLLFKRVLISTIVVKNHHSSIFSSLFMPIKILPLVLALSLPLSSIGQTQGSANNGEIDDITEFATIMEVPFTMPDSIKLMTDVYLPLLSDCLRYTLILDTIIATIPIIDSFQIEFIKKGTQIIIYDSITPPDTLSTDPLKLKWNYYDPQNLIKNPNPYQMPIIFTRTPYDKTGEDAMALMTLLGYSAVMQDMRGRYASEGVYMPMYSDSWKKTPYHPTWGHVLDRQTDLIDPRHGNNHEDGYNSIRYIADEYKFDSSMVWLKATPIVYDIDLDGDLDTVKNNSLTRVYDYNFDGVPDTFAVATPNIGTFGASALGNTQYQEAAAHKIDTMRPGLKCLLPIVATNEHFEYTGYHNGVFRDRIVTGWVKGQIFTGVEDDCDTCMTGGGNYFRDLDEALGNPEGVHNTLHTSWDYKSNNKFDAANEAIDHFVSRRYPKADGSLDVAGYYPNCRGRADMDASRAMLNATTGEGDPNGTLSRYTNMDVPAYHLFGWWDIFVDGQIETNNLMRKYASPKNRRMQKMVIGPWAHQTIGSTETGDQEYPNNIYEVLGLDLSGVDGDTLPLTDIFSSDIVSWYRHNLNYSKGLGEPKFFIPESQIWQPGSGCPTGIESLRIPAEDYNIPFEDFINFLSGYSALPPIKIEIILCGGVPTIMSFDIPANPNSLLPGLANTKIEAPTDKNFADPVIAPPVQFYVVGDGLDNTVGNYWFAADSFPLINDIQWTKTYMHQDGLLNFSKPVTDEGFSIYVHDPDDPILTAGGANMIVRTPQDDKNSQGQMNLADPLYAPTTMNRTGVISFTGAAIQDSLCIIGFPVATVYAKSNPGGVTNGPTDTDFFVRVLDVFPDGRELFVHEGCVNARGRDFARGRVHGADGSKDYHSGFPNDEKADGIDDIPFTNIEVGQLYEYKFKMMPIAYTWGPGHRMKILISSSNYTRYQVNPNLPIEDGEFFRRKPGDGKSYNYQGNEMYPRIAVQRIAFSDEYPSNIDLPIYSPGMVAGVEDEVTQPGINALVYPNPALDNVSVYMSKAGKYRVSLINISGQITFTDSFTEQVNIDLNTTSSGLYLVKIEDLRTGERIVEKISVQ